jgi:DNA-binding beta-propeller fold protein YncE
VTGAALRPAPLDSGCAQVKVTPDQPRLFVLNTDNSLTAVNAMTSQVEKTSRTAGPIASEGGSDFLIAPDGRTIYVADQYRGVVPIPVPY